MKITREIKTAVLVISALLLFIWGYSFLKGTDLFSRYKTIYVQYDSVEGLSNASPVTINGLIVGKVKHITLDEQWKSVVELQIKSEYPISKTSIAEIYSPGFIGGKQIAIIPDTKNPQLIENGDFLKPSAKLAVTEELAKEILPIKDKLDAVLTSANISLQSINTILDANTRSNIQKAVENLNTVLTEMRTATQSVNGMLSQNQSKINSTLSNFDTMSANFSKVSDSIAKANLGQTIRNMEKTLASVDKILNDIQTGKGTLGKLAKDDKLYVNFTKTSKELELLLQDLRLNPTRYVNVSLFGKKNKPYQAPVNDTLNK